MNQFDNITIIIPTYKRYDYLKRLVSFFLSFENQFTILILDSTPNNLDDLELINLIYSNNIKLIKFNENINLNEKIYQGTLNINTKYSLLCADDDFIFPSTIMDCINFLDTNLDYSSCHGLYCHYEYYSNFIPFFNSNNLNLNSIYKPGGGDENNIEIRIENYLSDLTTYYPFYAVHKTIHFKKIWHYTNLYAKNPVFTELFSTIASLIFGKMKILNKIYGIREMNNYSWINSNNIISIFSEQNTNLVIDGVLNIIKNENYIYNENFKIQLKILLNNKRNKTINKINKIESKNKNGISNTKVVTIFKQIFNCMLISYKKITTNPRLQLLANDKKVFEKFTFNFKSNSINTSRLELNLK